MSQRFMPSDQKITFPGRKNISLHRRLFVSNAELLLLALPAIAYFFIWHYLPLTGLVLAFKEVDHSRGIFGGDFIGFQNFKFFFTSNDAWRITFNTIAYGTVFIITGIASAAAVGILMYELRSRIFIKMYQTTLILPRFLSWVVVGFMSYTFLNPMHGLANQLLEAMGAQGVDWYITPEYWPFILVFMNNWKYIGLNSIMYYAFLMSVDTELYEAAMIDGANKWQQTWNISVPALIPLMIILGLLQLSQLFRGDFGLFYQIPRDVVILYPVTEIIDTYVYKGLRGGNYHIMTAVGLFQSLSAFIMIVGGNGIVKRIDSEKALF